MPSQNFLGFNIPQTPQPQGPNPTAVAPPVAPGFDMNAMIAAFSQMQQQQMQGRLQGQREFLQSQQPTHRGMGGGLIDQTTGKEAGNPFDNGFFKSPQERQQIIDTRSQGMPTHATLDPRSSAEAASQASPNPFQLSGPVPQLGQRRPPIPGGYPMPQQTSTPQRPPAAGGYMPAWNASPRPGFGFASGMR